MRKTRRINKRRKYSLRKRKSRRINMKGGRGLDNTCQEIGMSSKHYFADHDTRIKNIENLRLFTFGNTAQYDAWLSLLRLCYTKDIPVYILTSGNKIGIIITLQLAGLQKYFEDVLCVSDNTSVNPRTPIHTVDHNFHGKTKYEVIQQIMTEKGIPCVGERRGFFLDDVIDHSTDSVLCPSIEFRDVINPSGKPPDFNWAQIHENPIYNVNVEKLELEPISDDGGNYNFTPITIIEEITTEVSHDRVKILFLDFDKTFQMWPGAIPFHLSSTEREFNNKKYGLMYKYS